MMMSEMQAIILIAVVALCTYITRAAAFVMFPAGKETPALIKYLGTVLPFAMMGMLIVYTLKYVSVLKYPYGIPELIAVFVVVLLHKWKKNQLLSIGAGTVVYMFLVQVIFI